MAEKQNEQGWLFLVLPLLLAWIMIVFLAARVGDLSRRLELIESQRSVNP